MHLYNPRLLIYISPTFMSAALKNLFNNVQKMSMSVLFI